MYIKRILLHSYLTGNLGDDLFVFIISDLYKDVQFIARAGTKYKKWHIKNVKFYSDFLNVVFYRLFKKNIFLKRKFDLQVVLGGSMFIEQNFSRKQLQKILFERYLKNNRPFMIIGSNFGPYKNRYYYEEYKKVFAKAMDICFRENYSVKLFSELENIRVAPDVVFNLDISRYKKDTLRKVTISVINLEGREGLSKYKEIYEKKIAEVSDYYSENGYEVLLMSFCKSEGDEKAIQSIVQRIRNKVSVYLYRGNIEEALNHISSSELVIGTRFHSIILGFVFGKKVLPIVYSDKTVHMLNDIQYRGNVIDIKDIDKLDVCKINKNANKLNNLSVIVEESKKQFAAFNCYCGGENNNE